MFSDRERKEYIREKYESAPDHIKGTVVNRLISETELSRATIYRIIKTKD